MTWGDRLGRLRFYQQMGDPLALLVREAVKPALGTTALATYLGVGPWLSITIGMATVAGLLGLALGLGYLVVRYRVVHAHIRNEWENNPLQARTIELLETIARQREPAPKTGYVPDTHVTYYPTEARVRFSDGRQVDWTKAL